MNELPRLYDAHNHLQDESFAGHQADLLRSAKEAGVVRMVVNGSCEEDWGEVARLAAQDPAIIPGFGIHPWYHQERSSRWLEHLTGLLEQQPSAVGEIGLDRWKEGLSYDEQEQVFLSQWNLARRLNRPVSIHCLKAWGRLLELLKEIQGPACGFLLHSYGGPAEMVDAFVKLGACFSFPGYYLHPNKERQRETFRRIPLDRLLVETDAPDQLLPESLNQHPLKDGDGQWINHPSNLAVIYRELAIVRGEELSLFAQVLEQNFIRLFGSV